MTRQTQSISRAPGVDATSPISPWRGLSTPRRIYEDDAMCRLRKKASVYLRAGICLNISGTAGLGKTTLALRLAEESGRPVSFMTGNQWLTAQDFIGRAVGQSERTIVDKYVQSVRRTETQSRADWKDAMLASAMRHGHVLVYDEFTRAPPEANSTLLSVLEEGVLVTTDRASRRSYVEAHPEFRIVLTSNPHDYVGVNAAPDALMDRMVTLQVPIPPIPRVAGIVASASGLDPVTSLRIVEVVDDLHGVAQAQGASILRSAIMIARIAAQHVRDGGLGTDELAEIVADVLGGRGVVSEVNQIRTTLKRKEEEPRGLSA